MQLQQVPHIIVFTGSAPDIVRQSRACRILFYLILHFGGQPSMNVADL